MANEYLNRTPTSAGNRKVFTWAGWVRRNENGDVGSFFSGGESSTNFTSFTIGSNDQITVKKKLSGSNDSLVVADPKTRDPGSWYHIVINEDYVRESSRIFLNGVEIFDSGANFPSNTVGFINAVNEHRIGNAVNTDEYLQGEMSDIFFVDVKHSHQMCLVLIRTVMDIFLVVLHKQLTSVLVSGFQNHQELSSLKSIVAVDSESMVSIFL